MASCLADTLERAAEAQRTRARQLEDRAAHLQELAEDAEETARLLAAQARMQRLAAVAARRDGGDAVTADKRSPAEVAYV
jgi:hypothetical protein